ncbi:hypothetical protein SUDANB146_05023 [Streptomyces sp. enrichment culture]
MPLLTLCAVDAPEELWLLHAVLFAYGAAGAVHDAAESALVADAVDSSLLADFNGLRTAADEGMKLLVPPAGAALRTACGGPGVAVLDAASFLVAALVYGSLRVRGERPAPRRSGWGGTAEASGACGRTPCCARWSWRAGSPCCARA